MSARPFSYLDIDAGQMVTVSQDLLREAELRGDEQPDFLTARKTNGRQPNRLLQPTASSRFRQSLMCTSGGITQGFSSSVESDDIASNFRAQSTAPVH